MMIESNNAATVEAQERDRWEELRTVIQGRWTELKHEDLDRLKNGVDRLVDLVQQRYGMSLDDARRQVLEFEGNLEDKVRSAYNTISGEVSSRYRNLREGISDFSSDVRNFGFGPTVVDLARTYPVATTCIAFLLGAALAGGTVRSRRRRWY